MIEFPAQGSNVYRSSTDTCQVNDLTLPPDFDMEINTCSCSAITASESVTPI
jgi:hypothetical protein